MIYQAIGIGIVVSFAFYEIVGISPGGIVVPGYIARSIFRSADQNISHLASSLVNLLCSKDTFQLYHSIWPSPIFNHGAG